VIERERHQAERDRAGDHQRRCEVEGVAKESVGVGSCYLR
jgi:hypothetical protein